MYNIICCGGGMAYTALYNKYRPQTFDQVVGQKQIVTTLKNAIAENKIAHAYLFCGPRGTGKTTMARLFAKALNCEKGIGCQCCKCDACKKIASGSFPDVIELDAASNSSVDDVRSLIDNISFRPMVSNYKIYIIDEVHSMTKNAFNALLKTIEEPPEFAIFILATTDPQQLIPTILSRVQRFDFSKIGVTDLVNNMEYVLKSEKIDYEKEALQTIAELSEGGVRDSLSLLDKVVSYAQNKITLNDVNQLLGLLSKKDELDLINNIADKRSSLVLKTIRDKYEGGMDIKKLQKDLINICKEFLIYRMTEDESLLEHTTIDELNNMHITSKQAKHYCDVLLQSVWDCYKNDDSLSSFELTLLSLMQKEEVIQTNTENKKIEDATQNEKPQIDDSLSEMKSQSNGVSFGKEKDDEKKADKIRYTMENIVYLMNNADKDKRIKLETQWNNLCDKKRFDSLISNALSHCKCKVFSNNILIVSTNSNSVVSTLNKKEDQNKIMDLMYKAFEIRCHVLAINDDEYKEAVTKFRAGEKGNYDIGIDFGKEVDNPSTKFFNSIMLEDDEQ